MGTKVKYWLRHQSTGRRVMVKYARENTGEDWSEKLAQELARRIRIPCPRVELFEAGDGRGVLCWDFLWRKATATKGVDPSLIHGNELLFEREPDYPLGDKYGVARHTLSAVQGALVHCEPLWMDPGHSTALQDGFDTFVGYLLLDALIGNTDRHHENWGVVSVRSEGAHRLTIAPSYDHASSLGRELNDVKRQGRLGSSGRGTVADYASKAFSAFWTGSGQKLTVLDVLREAAALRPAAFALWKTQLERTTLHVLVNEVERVPPERLSETGKSFVRELLSHNYHRIVEIES